MMCAGRDLSGFSQHDCVCWCAYGRLPPGGRNAHLLVICNRESMDDVEFNLWCLFEQSAGLPKAWEDRDLFLR